MAQTVIKIFEEFLKNTINLDSKENTTAKESRDWLVQQIISFSEKNEKFPRNYTDKNIFYGSFERKTKTNPLDDIDIMVCMCADGCTYNEDINNIKINVPENASRFINLCNDENYLLNSRKVINLFVKELSNVGQYKKAEIKRNEEAAVLELNSYKWNFDIVPSFFTEAEANGKNYYLIPDGQGNWKKTDPRLDRERVIIVNNKHDGHVLNVIRAIKYWNKRPTMPTISSYLLENIILDYYESIETKASEFVDLEIFPLFNYISNKVYLNIKDPKNIQGNLNDLSYDVKKKISDRAKTDYLKAYEARKFEQEKKQFESINKWKEIFGDKFPKYE
jgi:hypothetical protein